MQLNPPQNEAVRYIDGPLLVLAGAGSGKTRVITEKIAYLVQKCGIKAHKIAAVTFTNKAAQEMRERVGQKLGSEAHGLRVNTFHTLGLSIIRQDLKRFGLKSGFSIFDAQDAQGLIKDITLQHNIEGADLTSTCQHLISQWKNDLLEPGAVMSIAENAVEQQAAMIYERYERALRAYNAVDFDDLIYLPVKMLENDAELLEAWQGRIHYLLVDEYQDTNTSQYRLVQLLTQMRQALTVVGDDDQSIYTWRGARPENLVQLQTDYPRLKLIKLEQNYRSTPTILNAANTLIANNPHVFEKKLWSELGRGEPIQIVARADENDEVDFVVNEILDRRLRHNSKLKDFAVLYRGNFQSRLLEMRLQAEQLPYQISGGTSFFARNEIKDVMAYLRLLINPDDDAAFLRVINVPRRGIGASTLESLALYAQSRECSMLSACEELGLETQLSPKAVNLVRGFAQWMQRKQRYLESEPMAAINEVLSDIGYEDWLLQNSASQGTAERRWANVQFLIGNIQKDLKKDEEDGNDPNIEKIISRLVLRDMLDQQEEEKNEDKIHLLTLHASKGLEFKHVVMLGVEEQLLPHRTSIEEDNIEEERRLTYVGITRAQQTLTMTYTRKRKQYGEMTPTDPSRFLDELPEDCITWPGRKPSTPEENRQRGEETLGGLKALFD
jgi:ATP-dependent DNA helicase Rep